MQEECCLPMVMPVGICGEAVNTMLDSGAMINVIDITKFC